MTLTKDFKAGHLFIKYQSDEQALSVPVQHKFPGKQLGQDRGTKTTTIVKCIPKYINYTQTTSKHRNAPGIPKVGTQ